MGRAWNRTRLPRLVAGLVGLMTLLGGCWVAPGGGPNRNGNNSVETVIGIDSAADMVEAWQTEEGWLQPAPVVAGRYVYSTMGGEVIAREVATGDTAWTHPLYEVQALDMFIHDGMLLVVEGGDPMFEPFGVRHDLTTGEVTGGGGPPVQAIRGTLGARVARPWRYADEFTLDVTDLAGTTPAWSTPVLVDAQSSAPRPTMTAERVVVSGKGLVSTDPASTVTALGLRAYAREGPPAACATDSSGQSGPVTYGCPVWAVAVDGTSMTAPVVSDDLTTVVVGTDAGLAYAISEATGGVLWTADVGSAVTADPAIAGDTVLVPTAADGLVALPLAGCGAPSCAPIWTSASQAGVAQQPVAAGGAVFVGHDGGILAAYPVGGCGSATCDPVWSTPLGGAFDAPMAIGSGHLLVTADSAMHAFAPR